MKIISWNVNGIRAAWSHGLSEFIDRRDADIYAFQETKTDIKLPMIELDGYYSYWSFCTKQKGYSGTLCLTKRKPMSVRYGLGFADIDTEGRIIVLEFEDFFFVNCYTPNSQHSDKRSDYRREWDALFYPYLRQLRYLKPTIVCGDFNVPLSNMDIYAESKWTEEQGFQSTERENLLGLLNNCYVDTYRYIHPNETGKYTWWSSRRCKRSENRGWRLDYFFVSDKLKGKVQESTMLTDVFGSDHCPIILQMDMNFALSSRKAAPMQNTQCVRHYQELLWMEERGIPLQHMKRYDMTSLWESIDWHVAEKHLEDMQMALAKSAYTNDAALIEKWQKKIVYSLDAKVLAVRHVCSTAESPGIDYIQWNTPHEKMSAALSLNSKGYHAMPSRLLVIKSKNGKERRIHIETYFDRAMQCLYSFALDPVAESWADRKSFAYRKGRSSYDLNEYIKMALSGPDAPEWIFIGDVHKCYESIGHSWIKQHIPMPEYIMQEFLEAGYVFGNELFPMDVGIGIGLSLSPIVANMTLDGMQKHIYASIDPDGCDIDYANGNLLRYADDIIVTARTETDAQKIRCCVAEFLAERGLELSEEKSRIINVNEGFTFMSRTYFKRGTQLCAEPSNAAIERFMGELNDTIKNYSGSQKTLIEKINKKIDGWVTYHKVTEADKAFRKMDLYINALILELCESKHPKWSREKILQRYWYMDADGCRRYTLPSKKELSVKRMADTLLVEYYAVKTNKNPYIDLDYYEQRNHEREIMSVTGVYRSIWNRQDGKCYYCNNRILRDDAKALIEAEPAQHKFVLRMAYVHKRCLDCSVEYIDTDELPSSLEEVIELVARLEEHKKASSRKFQALSDFFRKCEKSSITLTFAQIEEIMGAPLGASSLHREFWYRTGFMCVSQCWLDNGYILKTLYLEGIRRAVFHLKSESKNTASVDIPDCLLSGRVPNDAKYELENYFQYIIKKYGL